MSIYDYPFTISEMYRITSSFVDLHFTMTNPDTLTIKFGGAEERVHVDASTAAKQVVDEAARLFHFRP